MDLAFGYYISTYWPSVLILIGVIKLFDEKSSKLGNLILIILGGLLQADLLDILDINIWKIFWPILLIIIGLNLLIPKKTKSVTFYYDRGNNKDSFAKDKEDYEEYKNETDYDDITAESYISKSVILSTLDIRNHSKNFKGGNITCILGGMDLDLRGTEIKEKEVILNVNVLLGGIDIFVPNSWRVEVTASAILGGYNNFTRAVEDPDAPILKITGSVALAGMDIK